MNTRLVFVLVSLFFVMSLYAQAPTSPLTKKGQPNVAVTPFTGDQNVTPEQLNFITGKFTGELIASNAFTVLDRGKMEFILKEQGFQQSGACSSSECKVQMGQLLGVDDIIAGCLVRFGKKYAFRVDYIDVSSGQVVYSAESMESGELEDVFVPLCKGAAQQLVNKIRESRDAGAQALAPTSERIASSPIPVNLKKSPTWKLPVVIGLGLVGLGGVTLGYLANQTMSDRRSDYNKLPSTTTQANIDAAWKKVTDAQTQRNIYYAVGGALLATGVVVQFAF